MALWKCLYEGEAQKKKKRRGAIFHAEDSSLDSPSDSETFKEKIVSAETNKTFK